MIEKQQFIGLGVFGATNASELTRLGHEVLGIDSDEPPCNSEDLG